MKNILVLSVLLAIGGCATTPLAPLNPSPTEPSHTDVVNTIAPVLFVPCKKLPTSVPADASSVVARASSSTVAKSNLGTVMKMYSDLQVQYSNCAVKDDCLIAAVKGTQCKQSPALPGKPL